MSIFLSSILGDYTRQFYIVCMTELELVLAALIFSHPLKKRRRYPLWLLLALVLITAAMSVFAVVRTHHSGMLTRLPMLFCQFASVLLLIFLTCDEPWQTAVKTWCASVAVMEIGAHVFSLSLALCGVDDTQSMSFFGGFSEGRDMAIYYAIRVAVYVLMYLLLGRSRPADSDEKSNRHMALLATFALLLLTVVDSITSEHRAESATLYMVIRLVDIVICLFILLIRAGIITQGQQRAEMAVMDQVMSEQRKQYESIRENINIVNMRCHDLKHQLANLAGRLTDEEVSALQEAMNIYDSTIKTGNEVLDVVLYENQLSCQQEHIQLSCMADGQALHFMRTRHIYALFSNALRNAMEAVRPLPEDMRLISVNVEQVHDRVEITVSNYCAQAPTLVDGLPATTKGDHNHHGFGTMSMRYIAQQYGGTLSTEVKNQLFTLVVLLPVPQQQAA